MSFENIPDDLKSYNQFVVWKVEHRDGKPTKVPYNAHTGQRASVDDPSTWCDFDTACRVAQNGEVAGVGFMLSVNDPFGFIDLDDPWKTDANGAYVHADPQAEFDRQQNIAAKFDCYTERSQSRKGAHVIVRTPGVANGRRRGGVEVYTSARFMVMTGDVISPAPVAERGELFAQLWAEMGGSNHTLDNGRDGLQREPDNVVRDRMVAATNGELAHDLLNGNWQKHGYPSQSEADFALIDIIAFYTDNREQCARIFHNSALGARRNPTTIGGVPYVEHMVGRAFSEKLPTIDFSHLFKAPPSDELPVVMASALHGKPVATRQWHVVEIIPARTVTLFGGDGGTGKSLAALQLAVGTVLGRAWFGVAIQQRGGALFLTAEDDLDEVHRRLVDIAAVEQVPLSALDRLAISSLAGLDALMAVPGPGGRVLMPTGVYAAVRAHVERHRPTLVVLDTLADLFGGDEVNRAQVRQFVAMLRAIAIDFETTVVLLAHPSVAGMANNSGLSGSTAWNNSVRSRLYMTRENDHSDVRIIEVKKSNYGAVGQQIRVQWKRGAFEIIGAVSTAAAHRKANEQSAEDLFLHILAVFTKGGKTVARAPQSVNHAPKLFAKHPDANGITKQQFANAMDNLFAADRIGEEEVGYKSKPKLIIVAVETSNSTSNMPSNSTSDEFPGCSNSAENRASNLFQHTSAESPIPPRGESAPAWGGTHRP